MPFLHCTVSEGWSCRTYWPATKSTRHSHLDVSARSSTHQSWVLISPHLTWPDLTWPDLTSPHLTSPQWPHLTSPHLTSPDLTLPDLTWPDLTWPDLTWLDLTSPLLTWHHLTFSYYTWPALRPYQFGPMHNPDVTNGRSNRLWSQSRRWSRKFTSHLALVTCSMVVLTIWSALSWLLTSRLQILRVLEA